jgi:hypothetical protein
LTTTSDIYVCREQQSTPLIHAEEQSGSFSTLDSYAINDFGSRPHFSRSPGAQNSSESSESTEQNVTSYFQEPYPDRQMSGELLVSQNSNSISSPDESPYEEGPKMFGGILSSINTLYSLPIKQTSRNAELLHFCKSIDFNTPEAN